MDFIPKVGLEFNSEEEAYKFYNCYGFKAGFSIRREYMNKNKKTGQITSRKFTCSKEGFKVPDKRDPLTRNPHAETRTGCLAHITIKLNKENGKLQITEFESEHNHPLHIPSCAHMMVSQRAITEAQASEIDLADDSGIQLKGAYELESRRAGGKGNLGYTKQDRKNYLRTKRQRDMAQGELGSLLRYFQKQTLDNPSFFYDMQLDVEEKITNIFWADHKMISDYHYFGDVVFFDTTFGTNKEFRPFDCFVGFNSHREMVIFGAALLYDQTAESFVWVFETFLEAMSKKKPITIFTDQDAAMAKALPLVMPETYHCLCTWHMRENAIKHLSRLWHGDCNFRNELHSCIYEIEEEHEFESVWDAMTKKYGICDNNWVQEIIKIKEKWAKAYVKHTFTGGMRSTQLSESLNSDLRDYLRPDMDFGQFFKHSDRVVNDKRYRELIAVYNQRQRLPKQKIKAPVLTNAGEVYTSAIFQLFQDEYELAQSACIVNFESNSEYGEFTVATLDKERKYKVWVTENKVSCMCRKFETHGFLCSRAIKCLDAMNVKHLPSEYILKRWTKNARDGNMQDLETYDVQGDMKVEISTRYKLLCRKLVKMAARAAEFLHAYNLLDQISDEAGEKIDQIIMGCTTQEEAELDVVPQCSTSTNAVVKQKALNAKGVKKKEGIRRKRRLVSSLEEAREKKKKKNSKTETHVANTLEDPPENSSKQALETTRTPEPNISFTQLLQESLPYMSYALSKLLPEDDISHSSKTTIL